MRTPDQAMQSGVAPIFTASYQIRTHGILVDIFVSTHEIRIRANFATIIARTPILIAVSRIVIHELTCFTHKVIKRHPKRFAVRTA